MKKMTCISAILLALASFSSFASMNQVKVERVWKEIACSQLSEEGKKVDLEYCIDNSAVAITYIRHLSDDQIIYQINFKGLLNGKSKIIENCSGPILLNRQAYPVRLLDYLACKF